MLWVVVSGHWPYDRPHDQTYDRPQDRPQDWPQNCPHGWSKLSLLIFYSPTCRPSLMLLWTSNILLLAQARKLSRKFEMSGKKRIMQDTEKLYRISSSFGGIQASRSASSKRRKSKWVLSSWHPMLISPQLLDSAPYFLKKAIAIGAPDFLPTDDDVLRARSQTTGVVTVDFTVALKIQVVWWMCLPVKRERPWVKTWVGRCGRPKGGAKAMDSLLWRRYCRQV